MLDPLDFRYPGGKALAGLAEWICSKVPALRSWLIDADASIVD